MKTGNLRVRCGKVQPNPWNPNEMDPGDYQKLKEGLKMTLAEAGEIPPIIVRPVKTLKCYQIIDGFHRWKALQELGQDKIHVYSMQSTEKMARVLTSTLNYLRGRPNRVKYAQNMVKMIEAGVTVADLHNLLPENSDEIDMLLEEADVSMAALESMYHEGNTTNGDEDAEKYNPGMNDDVWVDVKFRVSVEQARIIESEIKRIGERLKGKNVRARAAEYMAVQSSQSTLPGDL